jgi:hypothetical protein
MEGPLKKHGVSHGIAVLACTITSALLVDVVRRHVPVVYDFFYKLSLLLVEQFGLRHRPDYITILIYASFLAVVWGVAFACLHSDR